MKVYLLRTTFGASGDSHLHGVFSTPEKAEEVRLAMKDPEWKDIEEVELEAMLNPIDYENVNRGLLPEWVVQRKPVEVVTSSGS